MGLKVTNNAFGTLNAGINSSATTIVLASGQGARFPSLGAGDYFYATLIDTSNNLEIVKVTARSTDTMTVVRGQDGTTARAYSTNDRFELRPTAAMLNEITLAAENALPKAGGTMTGDLIFSSGAIRLPGSITSDAQINFKNSNSSSDTYAKFPMNTQTMFLRPNGSGQLEFWSDGSGIGRVLGLDQNGRVTMPNQPAFKAGRNSAYTPGGNTDIIFNDTSSGATHFNIGGHYNTGNGRFTAPITGVYWFSTCVIYEQVPNNTSMADCFYLYKNGGLVCYSFRRSFANSGTTMEQIYYVDHANVVVQLAAGDYMTVRNNYASRVVHGNTNYTFFMGYLLG